MCDLCDFQEDLGDWIKENAIDGFTAKDATIFAGRVSSVIKSLVDNRFDVSPRFDEINHDEDEGIENTKFVSITGNKNDESVKVYFFFHSIVMHSSKKVSGMDDYMIPNKFSDYSIVFDSESMDDWEFEASRFFEKILKVHRKDRRLNLKINAETFRHPRDYVDD